MANVVSNDRAPLLDRKGQLLGIAQAAPLQLVHVPGVEAALSESFRKQWPNILIDQEADRRHYPPSCERTLSSVLVAISRSISSWWS